MTAPDFRDRRIAALEAEVARLRADLRRLRERRPLQPAGPVCAHVRLVMTATGMSQQQFAAVAGIDQSTVSGMFRQRHVRAEVARKALAVTAAPEPGTGLVRQAGASRRLQALACAGWSLKALAAESGIPLTSLRDIRGGGRAVRAVTAQRVRRAYDRLWDVPPPQLTRDQRGAVTRARQHAEARGWAPALAWDDDEIDDPAASPVRGWKRSAGAREAA